MATTDRALLDLGIKSSANDDDTLVSVVSNRASRLTLGYIKNLISQWSNLKNKPFDNISSDDFTITTDSLSGSTTLKLSPTISDNSHSHDNKRYLDKISESNDGVFLYDNSPISDWNTLTNKPFESFSEDDFVIDESNVVSVATSIKNRLHTHDNKEVIDKFSVDTNGNLLFNGQDIKADGIDFTALSNMLVQGDNITITPNTDSNTITISATIPESGINFTELSSMLVQGENISIITDESAQTITLNASGIDFTALSTAMTTGTLSGISITADTENSRFNFEVTGIPTIAIDSEGYWTINGERGENPTKAQGENGADGITPHIDNDSGNWFFNEEDTGVKAKGDDGYSPTISLVNTETGVEINITNKDNTQRATILNGEDGKDGITTIQTSKVDKTCTFLATGWSSTVPYTQTVAVEGITESLNPRIDIIISDNVVTGKKEEIAFSYVTKVTTGDGILTAYCYETKPDVDLNIMIEVI